MFSNIIAYTLVFWITSGGESKFSHTPGLQSGRYASFQECEKAGEELNKNKVIGAGYWFEYTCVTSPTRW
jgi:hypothetical protein